MLRSRITVHLLVTLLGLCASAGNLATGQERTVAPPERLAAPPTDAPVDEEILPARIPRAIDDELPNTRPSVSAGDRDGVRSPAMAATLYILEADWSKSPTARQVEADLLAAFEGLKLTESQRADIVKLAPSILFAPGNVPLYTPSHASGLLLWLKQHGLLKAQLQSIARSERIMEDSSFDLGASAAASDRSPQNPGSDRMTQRLEFLDKDQLLMSVGESDISEGPFITKKNVQQWLVGWESTPGENAISLVSSTIVFEQRRGEKDPRNLGSNHQKEAYFLIPDDHVAIVGTQEIFYRTLEHQMNNAPVAAMVGSPKVAVNRVLGILVLGKPAVDLSVNPGPTGFFVPDRIGTVKHERLRTRPVPQPKAGGYIDQSGRTYGMDLKSQPARRPARSNSDPMAGKPPATAAPTTSPTADATNWELSELARFTGNWRVTTIVTPAEGTPSPEDQFELKVVLDRFALVVNGTEKGHGLVKLGGSPAGPTFEFEFLKDHVTPTGGHLSGTYQFQKDGALWLTLPDTSVRPGSGVQPDKILKLAKLADQLANPAKGPATGDSLAASQDPGVAYKYRASATTELKSLYDAQERQVVDLAQRVRTAPAGDLAATELKNNLTSAVYRAFALRQQLNRVELKELEERLARSRLAIENREKIRDQVVDRRINDLLNPEFQWDDRRTTIDSAKSSRTADHPDVLTGGTVRTNKSVPAATGRALIESEYRQFEGEWQIVSEESAGKVTHNPRETRNRFVVKDGRMEGAEFVLNPSATPRQIDLRAEVGPKLYKSIRGIYEWVPHDQDPAAPILLRIRIPNPESKDTETRPVDFEQAGSFHTIVLERASTDHATLRPLPRVSDEADPKLQSEYRAMDGRWRLLEYSKDFEVLKVSDTECIVTIQGEKIDEAPFSLDLSKSPRQIDLKVKSGEETKWKTVRGIYRWEESPVPKGRRLRIAMRYPAFPESNSRPTDFLPTKEVNMTLLEWIGEIQPDESAPSSAPPIPDATAPSTFKTPEPADPKRP